MTEEKSGRGVDQEGSTARTTDAHTIHYSDSQRIEALAEAVNTLVVYETMPSGNKCKISFRSKVPKGKKKHGVSPEFLRLIADGLLKAGGRK